MDNMDKRAEAYDRIIEYEQKLHEKNQRRIKIGIRLVILVPLLFLAVMFKMDSSKVVFLVLWIVSMFGISGYLITVEYADYKIQEQLREWGLYKDDDIRGLVEDRETVVEKVIINGGKLILDKKQANDEWYEQQSNRIEQKDNAVPKQKTKKKKQIEKKPISVEEIMEEEITVEEILTEETEKGNEVASDCYEEFENEEFDDSEAEYYVEGEEDYSEEDYIEDDDIYMADELEEEEISIKDIMQPSVAQREIQDKQVVESTKKIEKTNLGMAYQVDEQVRQDNVAPRIIVTPKDIVVKSPSDYANYRKMKRGKR